MRKIVLLVALCATSCGRVEEGYPPVSAETQIGYLKVALEDFQKDSGRFPSNSEGLLALTQRPNALTETQWHGPYLTAAVPNDPWGRAYVYRCPGVHNTNGFDLFSLGPDGVSRSGGNDPDDVASWRMKEQ